MDASAAVQDAGAKSSAPISFLAVSLLFTILATAAPSQLDWHQHPTHRQATLTIPASARSGFTTLEPAITGITFTNTLADERSLTNQIFLNGSGVAAGDIDGDGLCDLYFCGLDSRNALYRNLGNWRFEDITAAASVACADQPSTGAALADIDGDGDLDLLVNGIGRGTRLFLNDGHGRFHEGTTEAGLGGTSGAASLALADIDGDGFLDLYVVNYRNDTMRDMPDIRFRFGVTNGVSQLLSVNGRPATAPEVAGRFSFDRSAGVLENGEPDTLYHNDGHGHFTAVPWTKGAFLDETGAPVPTPNDWGLSAMFRDIDGDGAPDLYVCNDFQSPDRIWINDGHGKFHAIARQAIRQTSLFSMGVDFADIDRDGYDDFFVADMLSREHTRRQVQVMDAMAFTQFRGTLDDRPQFSHNTLFRNRGNGTYAEIAQFAGLDASEWSWCPVFLDVDLDGYEDLLVTTGHGRDAMHADIARELDEEKKRHPMSALDQLHARRRFPRLDTPNLAFRNRGDLTFVESSAAWGFDSLRISHGVALADLDNDGDLDVVINCLNDGPLLLRNDSSRPRVAVRLRGDTPNTHGVGGKIRIVAPGLPQQSQELICGGRYLSSDDAMRTFAAGNATNRVTVEVVWRSGRRSWISDVEANNVIEVDERAAQPLPFSPVTNSKQAPAAPSLALGATASAPPSPPPSITPFFQDVSHLLNHQHTDEPFDDFQRQPLLPRKLSQLGPGVTWFDFNGDGWDDLFIGAGRGGRLGVFRNDGKGGFIRQHASPLEVPAASDLTAILAWRPTPDTATLLLGVANYESAATNDPALREFSMNTGEFNDGLLRSASSTGPLAMADFDGDGDLDLFVGGRVLPGRYPEAASSAILRNDSGRLRFDAAASLVLTNIGLVSSALFTDLKGDGWPDLVLACEWGPIRIFRNERGKLTEWIPQLETRSSQPETRNPSAKVANLKPETLNLLSGWWTSITAGDFDNDGRLDLVAGNWGRNHAQQRFLEVPLRLYFGDADGSGYFALFEARHDPGVSKLVPARDWRVLSGAVPVLHDRFPSFAAFAAASMADVLAAGLPPLRMVTAATFDSMLFLNRGDHFEARPLPVDAQLSPVFGLAVGDLDGDGNEDLFLVQNFFGVSPAESRQDAGCGLWLRGDGRGGFKAAAASESGFAVFGEGRGAALCDFDHDGRLDVVLAQNRGPTKLYRNSGARSGLRVHLTGLAQNSQAIGAVVKCLFPGGRSGPAHELRLGGGYWSQDSGEMILATPEQPESLEIRWPLGGIEQVPVTAGTRFISRTQPLRSGR
ncbi:MAG: hypothetical protein EXS31_06535 [Pedosphaera sp.]|nr:hypothetical protein [Pedosphaera sp.]